MLNQKLKDENEEEEDNNNDDCSESDDYYSDDEIEDPLNIKKLADEGDMYAIMLSEGRGINKKEETEYMRKAANKGNIYAMHLYGLMLYNGDGVTKLFILRRQELHEI